ncbi:MAG: TolC family protein [Massilibacteroides sp.]|nr:TolC family protein [Massilibacteroides sp.]
MVSSTLSHKLVFNQYLILFTFFVFPMLHAQDGRTLSLDSLQQWAKVNYPYFRQLVLNDQYKKESIKSIETQWLPQLTVSGKTSYQSEVTAVSLPDDIDFGFALGKGEKFQYTGQAELTQLIFNGGLTGISKEISKLGCDIQSGNIEAAMLQIESTVNSLFENILVTKEQIKMLDYSINDLIVRKKNVETAVKNGMILSSELQELKAELINLEQNKTDASALLATFYSQMSFITQVKIDTFQVLQWPVVIWTECSDDYRNRPDFLVFGQQIKSCDLQLKSLQRKKLPQLKFFADGYYGRPGLNAMDYSNHFSGIIGVKLQWNIVDFYVNSHEKKKIVIQKQIIQSQQNLLEIELNQKLDQLKIDANKNKELITKDNDIVNARSAVRETAAVQFENGAMTFADYLVKLNAESRAISNRQIHKIRLKMYLIKKKTLTNDWK